MVGGETEFPRWVNGETHMGLRVTPEKGKAVLFYSHLPDGNMDDLSQHAALPVTQVSCNIIL
jgi:prolyl 4-hydroxylase